MELFILFLQIQEMENPDFEKPPVFRSWKGWYILVISILVLIIVSLTFLTRYFQ